MTKKYLLKRSYMLFFMLSIYTTISGNWYTEYFLTAAKMGQLDIVEHMVSYNPNLVYIQDDEGDTALHYAIGGEGFLHVIKFLVAHGSDINKPNKGGTTPFYAAALGGWYFVVDFFIRQAANLNRRNHTNKTPVFWAALSKNRAVTRRLINANVRIDQETRNKVAAHFPDDDFFDERKKYAAARTHAFLNVCPIYLPNDLTRLIFEFEEGEVVTQ